MKPKSLVLFSGGLDSRLVAKIMQEQTEVTALHISIPFSKNNEKEVKEFCKKEKIKLKIIKIKGKLLRDYLSILKHPKYKRGSAYNPCIDCHIFMLKLAKEFADKNHIETIATGEVLGERPLSQNKSALEVIEKEAELEGRVLRPLSAKLLEGKKPEQEGLINRSKFFDIQGRKRDKQIELAKKFKITYPNPGGGCLLCEKPFSEKLKDLFKNKEINKIKQEDIELLKLGRHFYLSSIILGKNHQENILLQKQKGIKIIPKQPGPTVLVRPGKNNQQKLIEQARQLIKKYSKHKIVDFQILYIK